MFLNKMVGASFHTFSRSPFAIAKLKKLVSLEDGLSLEDDFILYHKVLLKYERISYLFDVSNPMFWTKLKYYLNNLSLELVIWKKIFSFEKVHL